MKLSVNGTGAIPTGPHVFWEHWDPGFGGGLGASVRIVPKLHAAADVQYAWFAGPSESRNLNNVYASVEARFYPMDGSESKVQFYFAIGQGWFFLSNDFDSSNAFGFHTGLGCEFAASETIDVFARVRFEYGATEGEATQIVPISIGVAFKLGS
jgi:opacity protein-like surface antigen